MSTFLQSPPNFSIVLPAYNEAEEVDAVLMSLVNALRGTQYSFEIVAVNNGSSDKTGDILEELRARIPELLVVHVPVNQGFGHGILEGLKMARGEVLGWMPADGQLAPPDIVTALDVCAKASPAILKGVRVDRSDTFPRLLQSKIYNALFQRLFKVAYQDINAPPKLFTRHVYNALKLESKDWFLDAELVIKATQQGFEISEIRMDGIDRKNGSSKVRLSTAIEFMVNMLRFMRRKF